MHADLELAQRPRCMMMPLSSNPACGASRSRRHAGASAECTTTTAAARRTHDGWPQGKNGGREGEEAMTGRRCAQQPPIHKADLRIEHPDGLVLAGLGLADAQ